MTPYHVARSKLFARERFTKAMIDLDLPQIEINIEHTRFPVPDGQKVRPYIGDALRYLRITQEGKQWVANLCANVTEIYLLELRAEASVWYDIPRNYRHVRHIVSVAYNL
jgi:hypothetical protein